ncbi:hypothetical protein NLU13_6537 [Sarocladium strictum]|uniref:CFEM domain-containing protein n=1 Tax=Sarocladium strictum TaxID=5046 RepID=A0AA39L777_SARSR|nr:hypothetical protein NLU13_6537 [Sarocladium strictum]
MHSLLSAFIALGAFQALAVTAQDPACLANCAAQVRADFTKFACANADDAGCLCSKADFKNGVRDCATPCGSAAGDVETFLNNGFCLAQAPPPAASSSAAAPSSAVAPEPATTQPPAPVSTILPETTAAPAPTTAPAPEAQPQPTTVPDTTEQLVQDTSSQPAPAETTAAPETTSAAAETETSSTFSTKTTAASNAGETAGADDETDAKEKDNGGLSKSAIIGIGVGVGAAGLAAIGLILWLCMRKRSKKDSRPFVEISKPMPASGVGDYVGRRDPFTEKRGDVMEMQSNRYEDMLPRQVPRTVV